MASSEDDPIDERPERICNLNWDSDYQAHRFGPSWASYPASSDDEDEGPCPECLSDSEEEPHFRVQLLLGSLKLPFSNHPSMDPSIWSRLPPHLIERALAMVPLAFSFRLALVSKSWFSLLSSPHFKKLRFELAKSSLRTFRVGLCASLRYGQEDAECPSSGACDMRKTDAKYCDSSYADGPFPDKDKTCISGNSEVNAGRLQDFSCKEMQGRSRLLKRSGKGSAASLKTHGLDGADEFVCSNTKQSAHRSTTHGTTGIDDMESDMEDEFFISSMPDAVCALEYQPSRLSPGCQPRWSDISYVDRYKIYKIYLSFLPKKFQFFLPNDCVVQDGFVCLFKAESFASLNSSGGCDHMKRLCFCVANPITKSWKELPSEVCTRIEFKKWREDWTVRLKVQNDNFTVCLLVPRERDGCLMMTVNTYTLRTGSWKLTFLQSMRYMTPTYGLEGEGKWPCYTICKGFLCTANHQRLGLETMIHNMETGELVYSRDEPGPSSDDDDSGNNSLIMARGSSVPIVSYEGGMCFPYKMASSCKGFFFVARHCMDDVNKVVGAVLSGGQIERAVKTFIKKRRQSGFAVWGLDLSNGFWRRVSKAVMPQKMRRKLMKRPPLDRFKVRREHGPKDVHILYVDKAVVAGDAIYMFLGLKEDYNYLFCDGDLRLWTGMVAYRMSDNTWELIYHGLIPRLHGNEWHVFRPNFSDSCLC